MSFKPSSPRAKPRWLLALGAVGAMSVLVAGVALAGHYQASLEGSNFEIDNDANQTVDNTGNTESRDWLTSEITPKADQPSGSGDNSFTQGTKEDTAVPVIESGSIPPNKSDLSYFGIYQEQVPQAGNTPPKSFVHLFWSRVQDPSGTTNMDFEFNQSKVISSNGVTPLRTAGDLLITYDLSRGGTQATISLREWSGNGVSGSWGAAQDITAAAGAAGTVNTSTILAEDSLVGRLDPRTFGEASIDLDFIFDENDCKAFGYVYLKSRSSASFTAALKDFIAPQPVNISNCGSLTIEKVTEGGAETFAFDSTGGLPSPAAADGSFSLTTTAAGEAGKDSAAFADVQAGQYTITETVTAGWELADIECTGPVDWPENAWSTDASDVLTVNLDSDDNVTCTFTNGKTPEVKVNKVTNPTSDTGKFDLRINTTVKADEVANGGTTGWQKVSVGSVTVDEVIGSTAPAGLALSDYDSKVVCDSGKGSADPGTSKTFTVAYGDRVECTITNARKPEVKVVKVTNPATDDGKFDLLIGGIVKADEIGNGGDTGFQIVAPGSVTVSETIGSTAPTGRTLADYVSDVSCDSGKGSADPGTSHTFSVAYGDAVTCTITNVRKGTVIVKKVMVGGTDTFSFTGTPNGSISVNDGTIQAQVAPGQYQSTESPNTGWELTSITCSDTNSSGDTATRTATFNVEAGETVTCTFTNTLQFTAIVLVCDESDDTLHKSDVALGAADPLETITAADIATAATDLSVDPADLEAVLCGLGGARFEGLDANELSADPTDPAPYSLSLWVRNRL